MIDTEKCDMISLK